MFPQVNGPSRLNEFERLLQDGILAARSGERTLAQSLLRQAILINGLDARPYVWLAGICSDTKDQREYLEQAVALDPSNAAARRGLAELTGKLDPKQALALGAGVKARGAGEEETRSSTFTCPNCGGKLGFEVATQRLTCIYCGYEKEADRQKVGGEVERPLDFALYTAVGHRWAEAQQRLLCAGCGALTVLAPGEKTNQCPYCGSNQFVESNAAGEIMDPAAIGLLQVDAEEVGKRVRAWLGRGLFAPDDLLATVKGLRLRPAYYSFWAFDGTLEARWNCDVNLGSDDAANWVHRSGVETRFFDDALICGVKALKPNEAQQVEPFNLKELVAFKPEYVAGWPVVLYDRSLADASLLVREKMLKRHRGEIEASIEPLHDKRNLQIGASNWSGMSYKHLLLPVWIGTYHYQKKVFHLLVNGQTGKVSGSKPRDPFKMVMAGLIAAVVFLLLSFLAYTWLVAQPLPDLTSL